MHPNVHSSTIYNNQVLETAQVPWVNEWNKNLSYIYTMQYYIAERKKEFLPFEAAWIELETIMLSEISQLAKDKYQMISPISEI